MMGGQFRAEGFAIHEMTVAEPHLKLQQSRDVTAVESGREAIGRIVGRAENRSKTCLQYCVKFMH